MPRPCTARSLQLAGASNANKTSFYHICPLKNLAVSLLPHISMIILNLILAIQWLIFLAYWMISATASKKTVRSPSWWKGAIMRVAIVGTIFLLFKIPSLKRLLVHYNSSPDIMVAIAGVVLCGMGLAFAIWARVYLGANWGMPMSLKENPELITAGPYKLVRHPIYSGMLLAMFGSALTNGLGWFVVFIIVSIYFLFSAKAEEKIMAEQFPDQYPAYKKHTKMLIPYIL